MKSIVFNQKNEVFQNYQFKDGRMNALNNLSQINIFIGTNNSGKSRLLRELVKSFSLKKESNQNPKMVLGYEGISINEELIKNDLIREELEELINTTVNKKFLNVVENKELQMLTQEFIDNGIYSASDLPELTNNLNNYVNKLSTNFKFQSNSHGSSLRDNFISELEKKIQTPNYASQYIPILRTLRKVSDSNLSALTKTEYFDDIGELKIFTGENFFNVIGGLQNALEKDFNQKEDFEKYLSNTFFNQQFVRLRSSVINKNTSTKDLFIKIGNESEFPIYQLGDGIQSIIILTYQLFLHKDEDFLLFIEEPELNLHPGMQRIFLETITMFPKVKVFFTTHSNHFLDMSLDFRDKISIYSFKKKVVANGLNKKAIFKVNNITNPDFNLLNELGVRNSSVFLSNCTIWVEGITDRFYIRKYLKLYQEYLKIEDENSFFSQEDFHFSFIEYGGNNITHWSFLDDDENDDNYTTMNTEAISGNIFLIADNDGADDINTNKDAKAKRLNRLKDVLDDRFYLLEAREIENLVNPDILKKALMQLDKKGKVSDWTVFDNVNHKAYQKEKIGNFIDNTIGIPRFADKSGTIKQKTDFAIAATEAMTLFDDLSQEAQELSKKIYAFIKENND